jgi:hypothetical protein
MLDDVIVKQTSKKVDRLINKKLAVNGRSGKLVSRINATKLLVKMKRLNQGVDDQKWNLQANRLIRRRLKDKSGGRKREQVSKIKC